MKLQVNFVLIAITISFYQVKSEYLSPKYEQDGILDESRRQKGKEKLEEFQQLAEDSPCWKEALLDLDSSCKTMSDKDQSRLALSFANCHFERSSRQVYPCSSTMTIGYCTSPERMGDSAFQIYTEFFTHASHMCYFIQSQLWQQRTESTIDRLSHVSTLTVNKLEESLEYHKEMEKKQSMALQNQVIILDQDKKIAKSLEKTHSDMDEAFQEMLKKTETQKLLLNDIFDTLNKGFGNVQWLLSSILGEIISLETAGFFVTTFLFISFLPQFGLSRLWMYSTLIIYGVIEGGVRRVVLWIVDPRSHGAMPTLHFILWYSRWSAILCLSFIYFWRYLVHTKSNAKQIKLLQEMRSQLSDIKMSVCQHVVDETINEEVERNQIIEQSYIGEDVDDDKCPTIPVTELYRQENRDHIVTGTQLVDFLSGLYIHQHAKRYQDTESVTDSTYLVTSSDYTTLDMCEGQKSLGRSPLIHQTHESTTSPSDSDPSVSDSIEVTKATSTSYCQEKEILYEKEPNNKGNNDSVLVSKRRKQKKLSENPSSTSKRRSCTPSLHVNPDNETSYDSGISDISGYNLRPRQTYSRHSSPYRF